MHASDPTSQTHARTDALPTPRTHAPEPAAFPAAGPPPQTQRSSFTRRDLLAGAVAGAIGTGVLGAAPEALAQFDIPTSSRELWQWARVQPVGNARVAWLDAASSGPTLRAAMAEEYRAREIQSLEIASFVRTDRWSTESIRLATRFAAFAGCDPEELLFTRGAGEALSMVAGGLDLASGDEILTTAQEHPAAISPWLFQARRRGVVVKQITLPAPLTSTQQVLEQFSAALSDRTKIMAFSHVQYADGALLPVRELCQLARQHNIVSVVDGAQALGMLNFNLRDLGCDFYAAAFHKWLGGCHGTGMLHVRRDMLDRLWPLEPRGIDASPPLAAPAQAPGQSAVTAIQHKLGNVVPQLWPALKGGAAALEFHDQIGRVRIEARIRELVIYARMSLQQLPGIEWLTPNAPGLWGGILTFRLPGRVAANVAATLAGVNRVYFTALDWPQAQPDPGQGLSPSPAGALRLSLHIFNSHDDVDRLVQGLRLLPKS